MVDPDSEPFDVTRVGDVDVDRPLQERPIGGLGLHLVLFEEDGPRHLNYAVHNTLPKLALRWLDAARIEFRLANGNTEVLSVAQFQ